jgi:hypothetical protein
MAYEAAAAEGLTLVRANNATGFKGVHHNYTGFSAKIWLSRGERLA